MLLWLCLSRLLPSLPTDARHNGDANEDDGYDGYAAPANGYDGDDDCNDDQDHEYGQDN